MPKINIFSHKHVISDLGQTDWSNQQYQCGTDCACESGLKQLSPPLTLHGISPQANPKLIPYHCSELYLRHYQDYLAAFNPKGRFGVALLDAAARQVFEAVDGSRTLEELATNLEWTMADLGEAISALEEAELVYTTPQEPAVVIGSSQNVAVWMHITNQCNLRCSYCYISKTAEHMSLERGQQALREIFETARHNNRSEVVLKFAGGESLVVFALMEQLTDYARQLAKEQNILVKPIILTNGTLIDDALAAKIKAADYTVALSLDGLEEYNDLTRPLLGGQGSFKKIEKGLNCLLQNKVRLTISVVVTRHNLHHLPALARYLLEKGLSFTFNFFRENELAADSLNIENAELSEWLGQAYDVIGELLPPNSLMNAILDRVQFNQPHLQACGVGTNYIVVKHTGEIVSCQMHTSQPGIGKIGQGKDLLQVIRQGNFIAEAGRSVESKADCHSCQWRYVCAGGCPIMAWKARGSYTARSPFCDTYKALIPRVLDLEAARLLRYAIPDSASVRLN